MTKLKKVFVVLHFFLETHSPRDVKQRIDTLWPKWRFTFIYEKNKVKINVFALDMLQNISVKWMWFIKLFSKHIIVNQLQIEKKNYLPLTR